MHGQLTLRNNISTEEAYRLIDEAIVQHKASILALKSQRNDVAYISRLPPELLCRILSLAQKTLMGRIQPYSEWIPLTHVSRHWRYVAINSPSLWIEPSLGNLQWLEEALSRSKNSGLNICGSGSKNLPGLKLALRHSSRIKDLSIFGVSDIKTWDRIQKELPKSAPRLESLCLEGEGAKPYLMTSGNVQWLDALSISKEVFCDTKRLRQLALAGCNINWDSHPLLRCSLTRLILYNLMQRPSRKQFMDAMKAMPDLEYLHIINAFPDEQTSRSWALDHIHFARLRTLSICSNEQITHEVENFFQLVSFPSAAMVEVTCCSKQSSNPDYSGIISGLGRSYPTKLSGTYFQTLIMSQPFSHTIRFKLFMGAFTDEMMICHIGPNLRPTLELEFRINWDEQSSRQEVIKNLMSSILSGALPLQDVRHIYLDRLGPEFDSRMIANTFGRLPQVEYIMAGRDAGRLFVDALKLCSNTNDAGSTYFRTLSSICFFNTRITNAKCEDTDKNASNSFAVPAELLQECFIHRLKCGVQIKKLTLIQCRGVGQKDTLKLLKEIAPVVDVYRVKKRMFARADKDSGSDVDTEEDEIGAEL